MNKIKNLGNQKIMTFWLDDPTQLINDVDIFPDDKQTYSTRLNSITRLIILVSIVMYLLKIKGSIQFLIFGILLIIILYYTQRDMHKAHFSAPAQEAQIVTTPSLVNTPIVGSIWYEAKHGPVLQRYTAPPVAAPNAADSESWGGYHPMMNQQQPSVVTGNYENKIFNAQMPAYSRKINYSRNQPARREGFEIPPMPQRVAVENERAPPGTTSIGALSPIAPQSMFLDRPNAEIPAMNSRLPFNLAVEGKDDRFNGNEYYVHRQSQSNPERWYDYVQPINNASGVAYVPSYKNANFRYDNGDTLSWDPKYVRDYVSHGQQMNQSTRDYNSEQLDPYQAKPVLSIQEQMYNPIFDGPGDGYRSVEDIHSGNTQYYYNNVDPFSGPLFITRSKVDHMDYMDPAGRVLPKYERVGVTSQDYMDIVMDRQLADELYFRENMVAEAQARMNERDFQMRMAPIRGYAGQIRQK